jgi:uncharacterized protein (TIGR01619 family)
LLNLTDTTHWDFYACRVNDVSASIRLNLSLHSSAPHQIRPHLLWVWLYMRNPRADGFSDSSEANTLWEIEEAIQQSLTAMCDAQLVGVITTAGRREFYFYASSPAQFAETVATAIRVFPVYDFDFGEKPDPEWAQYRDVLYPSPRDLHRISNRQVVENLQKNADPLTQPRDVQHWIYFPSAESRDAFSQRVVAKGFVVRPWPDQKESECRTYTLSISRTDRVDLESINSVVLDLFELANELDGEYDGWETQVLK